MINNSFRVAMLNTLRIGPYDKPYQANPSVNEWLIAARSGTDGAFLMISDTSISADDNSDKAPDELVEQNTIVAVLAERDEELLQFLMLRYLPNEVSVPGRFFPADGMAALSLPSNRLQLKVFGRHAHSRGTEGGQVVLYDIPQPAPSADGAINWHFAAEERPWIATT